MTERSSLQKDSATDKVGHAILISRTKSESEKIELTARWILQEFETYYSESRHIPDLAKQAFEQQDPRTSLALSKKRLSMYSISIRDLGLELKEAFPLVAENEHLWDKVQTCYLSLIEGRYEADLAFAYIHSVRRKINQGEWKPVEYAFSASSDTAADLSTIVYRSFPGGEQASVETIAEILKLPKFSTPYGNLARDATLVAERLNYVLSRRDQVQAIQKIEAIDAGFYRNRGVYIVGRIVLERGNLVPLIIALLNDDSGIYVDAVLNTEADAHNLFSSTLANFNVTNPYYHELTTFLHSIMPKRPSGLHYSTIGFNHVGKVAVMSELQDELARTNEVLETAIGFRGTVAIGFSAPSSAYNLKIIRDKPTAGYKWGEFEGIDSVLTKYGRVHEINRTGSMLDNIIYYNLKLDEAWFDPELLEELLREASKSISLQGDAVVFKYLIVQRRMTPLPVFLETASPTDAEIAIVNLGYCIKNNAAANIFNKDLDARNYGVSRMLKVFLYDYDALEPFTGVKIRTNKDVVYGEEDTPDWYFEDGVVFLPEEIEAGLRIPNRSLVELFREVHGDLLTTEYWERIQNDLWAGRVPSLRVYPESRKLLR
ncbi:MAG: bifunctional isocitrate dehydrogenase kinase/phosphatase [Gammaproteobacteria bacterium]|nr:bifunctional isocitrate dehydrogenase kinase/phosphatase [Gammaproteobacteria bacterium]